MPTAPDVTALVEDYYALACKCAHYWARDYPFLSDDLVSEAGTALWDVARKYDPATAKSTFASWVHRAVRWACYRRILAERRTNAAAFIAQVVGTDEKGNDVSLLDLAGDELASADDLGHELEAIEEVHSLFELAELSPRYREAALRVLGRGEPARVLAQEQRCSDKRVNQVVRGALQKLKVAAEERDGAAVA